MATPLRLFRQSVLSLRLMKCFPASANSRRYLLSNAYACNQAWTNHLDDPALQQVHLPDFSNKIYDYLAKGKNVSPIDMNVLAHNFDQIQDEDEAEYIADIIARYNRSKTSINRSEATCHATVRGFMNRGYTDVLVEMLTDRLHYGLFPNPYSLNLLLDHFIKEKDYHNAAKVSYCSMIQEDFSNPINARLCLYAAVHHLLTCNIDDLVPPPKEQSDGEEKWVKVDYIQYPYYDDHFDIKDERFLLGKTLVMVGGVTNIEMPDSLRTSLKVIGLGLYHKFDRGLGLLRDILQSTNSSVSQQALDHFESSLEKVEARDPNEPEVELGLRTIDDEIRRFLLTTEQKAAYQAELGHLKETLNAAGKVQGDFNIGPVVESFLQPAGDDLFSVLYDNNFTYDATMTYSFPKNLYSPVLWPFTLDYGYTLVCNIARCPQGRYPGLWILPVVVVMDHTDQKPCAYVDDCANMPGDKNEAYQMLWKNFLRNYRSNRAPLYLNLHSPWLNTPFHLEALDQFLDKMAAMDDVYLVTVHQALQWQMDPHPLGQLQNFTPWQCPHFQPHVEDKTVCSFTYKHKTAPGLNTTGEQANASYPGNESQAMNNSFVQENPETMLVPSGIPEQTTRASSQGQGRPQKPQRFGGKKSTSGGRGYSTTEADPQTTGSGQQTGSGIHHHHRHKTHRPWFLKGSTATTFVSRLNLSTLTFIVCIFYGMIT